MNDCDCVNFQNALECCTDNEGYGSLIRKYAGYNKYIIGSGLEPINFCPWCGKEIQYEEVKDENN